MSAKVRVSVVDDSSTMRAMLLRLLASTPDVTVVSVHASAADFFANLAVSKPDAVTLDVEMPGMNGLEVLERLTADHPKLRVVMCSSLTKRGRAVTVAALCAGAFGAIAKPSSPEELPSFRDELVRLLLAAARSTDPTRAKLPATPSPVRRRPSRNVSLVVLGSSTGGPNAITAILRHLRAGFELPIVIAQHLPLGFAQDFVERLRRESTLPAQITRAGLEITRGLYVADGGAHLRLESRDGAIVCATDTSEPRNGCRPAVDVLFESAARAVPERTLGIVLTGMGRDGASGAKQLHDAGGQVWVQSKASSVVWGMPGAVVAERASDAEFSLEEIATRLGRLALRGVTNAHDQRLCQ